MTRAILTYHSIDQHSSPISVSPDTFAQHVAYLSSDAVNVVPLDAVVSSTDPRPTVALTFDDGLSNFASHAWPHLRDHGLPCSLFVVTDCVGETNKWNELPSIPEQRLLDWDDLGRLASEGVALGAHSQTHAGLPKLPQSRFLEEISGAHATLISRTGVSPTAFAYPYGSVNADVATVTRELYSWGVTTQMALLGDDDDALLLPRIDAFYLKSASRLESLGRPAFARFVRWRRFLRRLRRLGT